MKRSMKVGVSFGVASGITETLGMMVGLSAATQSQFVVIGGLLAMAIAESFSDSLGIHMSEESENKHTSEEIWTSTLSTFFSKLLVVLAFIVPILLFDLVTAILVSIVVGLVALAVLSYYIAHSQKANPVKAVSEHLLVAVVIITLTNLAGSWVASVFGSAL